MQPRLGLLLAVMGDHGRDQRHRVGVLPRPRANLALPLRVGEFLVGHRRLLHALLRHVEDPRPLRQCEPVSLRIAQAFRNGRDEIRRRVWRRHTGLFRARQQTEFGCQQHVGGAVCPFRLHAFDQTVFCVDEVDLDARGLREVLDQRLDEIRLAIRVDVDLVGKRRDGRQERGAAQKSEEAARQKPH